MFSIPTGSGGGLDGEGAGKGKTGKELCRGAVGGVFSGNGMYRSFFSCSFLLLGPVPTSELVHVPGGPLRSGKLMRGTSFLPQASCSAHPLYRKQHTCFGLAVSVGGHIQLGPKGSINVSKFQHVILAVL